MNTNKVIFLVILFFGFSSYCMEEGDTYGKIQEEERMTIEAEIDFPPLGLFLDDVSLLRVESIVDELKEAKEKKRNSSAAGIVFMGYRGTGKFTLAQIIRKDTKWKIFAIEAQDLILGQYLVNENEEGDEQIAGDPINKVLNKIIKNLEIGDTVPKGNIVRTIKNILIILQRLSPVILFLHNIGDFAKSQENYLAFSLFIRALKQFRPVCLIFVISSFNFPQQRSVLFKKFCLELANMFEWINLKRPDYKKRTEIIEYYFNKYQINSNSSQNLNLKKRVIREEKFMELLTATREFSGSDIEELIRKSGRALNAGIQNKAKVSTWFVFANDYDFDDRVLLSFSFVPLSPVILLLSYYQSNYDLSDAEHFLFSFCSIQQNKIKLKKELMLADKIACGEQQWSLIDFINDNYKEVIAILGSIFSGGWEGACFAATSAASNIIQGAGKGLQDVSQRYITVRAEEKFPEIKPKEEDKKQE